MKIFQPGGESQRESSPCEAPINYYRKMKLILELMPYKLKLGIFTKISGCGRAAETTNHIFRECPVATKGLLLCSLGNLGRTKQKSA
ncbi:hypothetical protein Gotur_023122 [Gossypium turneri]